MPAFGITDHLEGPRDQASASIYAEVIEQTIIADRLGFQYAWFTEHHAHAHRGHLPAPSLLALHLAGLTSRIRLGTAIICLNLHHPLAVAEQVAVADTLMKGRSAFGFGSGSTPEEFALFGAHVTEERQRHLHFEAALRLMRSAWRGEIDRSTGHLFSVPPHAPLPMAAPDLASRSWLAVNSAGSARIAGALGFNMLYSHLRTPEQYCEYRTAYRSAGGAGLIAANRPVHVAKDDATAFSRIEPALRRLWRRFQAEGKIPATTPEPRHAQDLCGHPINFIVGAPGRVARALRDLHEESPYDVANVEVRWDGLTAPDIHDCLYRLAEVFDDARF
ncbi:MAG TPA: LLM class flavin-dependent oxidoreductase [Tepidisphaeraceae bacterium]|jgi:alkanesulfonate monooxygenase SsuD/methylene tetrahydromethanopterin reductase-like flavin-dependent oxidoreductase (luciferase family)|nr:LLM class flavin-dependent oxidoreductase [Tepidisphaeraceae bacterium]